MEKLINIVFLLIMPFLYIGIINRVKAFWAGRKGSPIIQPFYDFFKLLKKGEVISKTASFIFQIAPVISFSSIFLSGLLVPMVQRLCFFSVEGSFILFSYILALGKFLSIIGAMDTGSSFEGMGASREATFSNLVEPSFFIIIGTLALISNNLDFSEMLNLLKGQNPFYVLIIVLIVISFFVMLLTEGCRVPVDDPNTHLELTMIHEVMVLDNSGVDMAFIFYASGMKMVIITSLIAALVIPANWNFLASVCGWLGIEVVTAFVIGTVESLIARLKMNHVPQFIFIMTSTAIIILSATALWLKGGIR